MLNARSFKHSRTNSNGKSNLFHMRGGRFHAGNALSTFQDRRNVFGRGRGNVPTRPRPNCKLFTCQLVLVAAAPGLQDFHPGEKVGWGGGDGPLPPGSYGPAFNSISFFHRPIGDSICGGVTAKGPFWSHSSLACPEAYCCPIKIAVF